MSIRRDKLLLDTRDVTETREAEESTHHCFFVQNVLFDCEPKRVCASISSALKKEMISKSKKSGWVRCVGD